MSFIFIYTNGWHTLIWSHTHPLKWNRGPLRLHLWLFMGNICASFSFMWYIAHHSVTTTWFCTSPRSQSHRSLLHLPTMQREWNRYELPDCPDRLFLRGNHVFLSTAVTFPHSIWPPSPSAVSFKEFSLPIRRESLETVVSKIVKAFHRLHFKQWTKSRLSSLWRRHIVWAFSEDQSTEDERNEANLRHSCCSRTNETSSCWISLTFLWLLQWKTPEYLGFQEF